MGSRDFGSNGLIGPQLNALGLEVKEIGNALYGSLS